MAVESAALIKVLNKTCLNTLQGAAGLALTRTNPSIEIEHWLVKLVEQPNTDCSRIFRQFEIDPAVVLREVTKTLDGFRRGVQRNPEISLSIVRLIQSSWVVASLQYHAAEVRSGVLMLALLDHEELGRLARNASRELSKIKTDQLQPSLMKIVAGSVEDEGTQAATPGAENDPSASASAGTAAVSKTPALDQYTINLTDRAKRGEIDPVVGREAEVRQMVDILIRRRQNNPILTGEAGVGKTAVVEGLARRIAQGDVPPALQNVVLRTLDLGLLQAGASVKGEFENRLKQVIAEVKASPVPVIVFIDEAHTLIGAGGSAGQGDAANLLKPALARGELRTIAATTWAEYKKYFEKDAALARRFQVVKVEEPREDVAVRMMRGLTGILEKHHGVRILDEAVEAAVKLSHRYIPARQLPDKAVSLLDTACARVAIGQNAIPPAVEDCRREIEHLELEIQILDRERATGSRNDADIEACQNDLEAAKARLAELEERWEDEKARVAEIRDLAGKVEGLYREEQSRHAAGNGDGGKFKTSDDLAALQGDLNSRSEALAAIQGEEPLMQVFVDAQTIGEVVAGWTGIPVGRMLANEIQTVLNLRERLEQRVIGQTHALEAISQRIRTARANLTDPRRPIGVFLLVGSSGVGKTETALALAEALYGGERNLITINMSEYQESHTVSGLKGSPPGYVGYGEGGVLTEAVRRRPYSVVLLDEVEKAHPDVLELFFQVFDKGTLEDGEGREIDFKNTIILLTSNVGTETILELCRDAEALPTPEELGEAVWPDLLAATSERGVQVFKQAFLGRLIVVPYYPISDEVMRRIIRLQLGRVAQRMRENHDAAFTYDEAVVECIGGRCKEVQTGGRNVDHILTRSLLPEISQEVLARMAQARVVSRVHISVGDDGGFAYAID
ncbi:type VI secretion system ATPase TssH [Paludisphaera mucosa]|uniref:Type VI secretion system ATPase TssH n=1 Tax=Paludisphaera mucosa TaxID=3030827 RepID=A0ABT6FDZ4_9BACT|nr:type VI secretion system ATPase TssH [Paludisphaera mucosa]MDG3005798.1 type VI secretion system ATPase TssH [Paludisphaera mucosa]